MNTFKLTDPYLENDIFVFGANTQGRHGKGAALHAKEKFGAVYGQAEGLQGRSFAIITKDLTKWKHPSRTPEQIKEQISKLYYCAFNNPEKRFKVCYTAEGSNLNAYTPAEMAKMFYETASGYIPENVLFTESFKNLIIKNAN